MSRRARARARERNRISNIDHDRTVLVDPQFLFDRTIGCLCRGLCLVPTALRGNAYNCRAGKSAGLPAVPDGTIRKIVEYVAADER